MAKLHPTIDAKKIVRKFGGTAKLHRLMMRYGYKQITRAGAAIKTAIEEVATS